MGRSSSSDARRLVGLCFSFFVLFSAFYAAQTQVTPTLGAFGSLSLGLLYGCLSLAAPLAPAALRCLGRGATRESLQAETRALALASFLYCPFMAACARTSAHGAQLATSALLGLAAGLLWVAQGSLLTASTTSENRGRWSGVFWASFMGGNAAGNLSAAALFGGKVSVPLMFLLQTAVCVLSSLCFLLLVRPRRRLLTLGSAGDFAESLVPSDAPRRGGGGGGSGAHGELQCCADTTGGSSADGACLRRDLSELVRVVRTREGALLLPLLLFIGAEIAFWNGAYAELTSHRAFGGGQTTASLAVGILAAVEVVVCPFVGLCIDRRRPTLGLAVGLAAFGAALAIIQLLIVPQLPADGEVADSLGDDDGSTGRLRLLVFAAAVLMGIGDAAANTVAVARLGSLADEHGLFVREAAFQYFQCANVAMTALAFVYAPYAPLARRAPPIQPIILCSLGVVAFAAFNSGMTGSGRRHGAATSPADQPNRFNG